MYIALMNSKGGCGKTTSVMFLAQEFTDLGYSVTVIDIDPQRSATRWATQAESLPFEVIPLSLEDFKNYRQPEQKKLITLIDCPPGDMKAVEMVSLKCKNFLVPMKCSVIDVERGVITMRNLHSAGKRVLPIFTMVNKRTREFKDTSAFMSEQFPSRFGRKLPADFIVRNLTAYSEAGNSNISKTYDYAKIAQTISHEWSKK